MTRPFRTSLRGLSVSTPDHLVVEAFKSYIRRRFLGQANLSQLPDGWKQERNRCTVAEVIRQETERLKSLDPILARCRFHEGCDPTFALISVELHTLTKATKSSKEP